MIGPQRYTAQNGFLSLTESPEGEVYVQSC